MHGFQEIFGRIGFAVCSVLALAAAETAELVRKFARRNGLAESVERTLTGEVARPECASLAQVPVTLNLLLHVLAKEGVEGAVLSRSRLYDRAVRMMVQASTVRGRLQGEERVGWTLDTLRSVAFWNQHQGARSQRWEEFGDLGAEVSALRRQVERGVLPLLESAHGQVQFVHRSS